MHGNAVAFDAVLRELELERFDAVVSLGDVAQGGPQPAECIDRLRELGCRCVLGNSDEFLLTLELGSEEVDDERREQLVTVGRWSQQQLGDEQLAFLGAFEPTVELDVSGSRLVCCHGSPASNEEVVLPETPREKVEELIGRADAVAAATSTSNGFAARAAGSGSVPVPSASSSSTRSRGTSGRCTRGSWKQY